MKLIDIYQELCSYTEALHAQFQTEQVTLLKRVASPDLVLAKDKIAKLQSENLQEIKRIKEQISKKGLNPERFIGKSDLENPLFESLKSEYDRRELLNKLTELHGPEADTFTSRNVILGLYQDIQNLYPQIYTELSQEEGFRDLKDINAQIWLTMHFLETNSKGQVGMLYHPLTFPFFISTNNAYIAKDSFILAIAETIASYEDYYKEQLGDTYLLKQIKADDNLLMTLINITNEVQPFLKILSSQTPIDAVPDVSPQTPIDVVPDVSPQTPIDVVPDEVLIENLFKAGWKPLCVPDVSQMLIENELRAHGRKIILHDILFHNNPGDENAEDYIYRSLIALNHSPAGSVLMEEEKSEYLSRALEHGWYNHAQALIKAGVKVRDEMIINKLMPHLLAQDSPQSWNPSAKDEDMMESLIRAGGSPVYLNCYSPNSHPREVLLIKKVFYNINKKDHEYYVSLLSELRNTELTWLSHERTIEPILLRDDTYSYIMKMRKDHDFIFDLNLPLHYLEARSHDVVIKECFIEEACMINMPLVLKLTEFGFIHYFNNPYMLSVIDNHYPGGFKAICSGTYFKPASIRLQGSVMNTVSGSTVGTEEVKAIAEIICRPKNRLRSLQLIDCKIGNEGAKAIADALRHPNNKLTSLLIECNISNEGVEAIADALRHPNNKLTSLHLKDVYIDEEGVKAIADTLCHKENKLSSFNLNLCTIDVGVAKAIADALRHPNNKLTSLHLIHCNISNERAKAIADALRHPNNKLTTLTIYCAIDKEGLMAIAEALKQPNSNLICFNISNSKRNVDVTAAIEAAVQDPSNKLTFWREYPGPLRQNGTKEQIEQNKIEAANFIQRFKIYNLISEDIGIEIRKFKAESEFARLKYLIADVLAADVLAKKTIEIKQLVEVQQFVEEIDAFLSTPEATLTCDQTETDEVSGSEMPTGRGGAGGDDPAIANIGVCNPRLLADSNLGTGGNEHKEVMVIKTAVAAGEGITITGSDGGGGNMSEMKSTDVAGEGTTGPTDPADKDSWTTRLKKENPSISRSKSP